MVRHFIDIDQFSKKQIEKIILSAKQIKKYPNKYKNVCKNKTLGIFFEKQSTRTRLSFTVGMQKLGGNVIELDSNSIGFGFRESEEDILRTVSQYIDCLMIRNHSHKKVLHYKSLDCLPIINGLTNFSHPCQILGDLLTIQEKIGKISNKKICWIGDYNNVLRSLVQLQKIYSFNLTIILPKEIIKKNQKNINKINHNKIIISSDLNNQVIGADCVMTDVWLSMGEKNIKKKSYFKKYQVNKFVMRMAGKKAIFMHCLPAKRGEEVTSDILDGPQSVVWQQAQNRMYVQQAILKYIFEKK